MSNTIYKDISFKDVKCDILDEAEIEDIRLRCRYLRIIKKDKARNLIKHVCISLDIILKQRKYSLILTEAIDNYIYDILFRLADKNNISTISYIHSFINGYVRISSRGERLKLRNQIRRGK